MAEGSTPNVRTVADVMTRTPLTASSSDTVAEAASRMRDARVGSIVVVDGRRPIGIMTERDLVRFAATGADTGATKVSEWMTDNPDTVAPDLTCAEAWKALSDHGYRHIPVVENGELAGIVSMRDLMGIAQLIPAEEAPLVAPPGLKGVIVAETALGDVRGLEGFYHYRQYSAPELADKRSFEDVWRLMFDGDLPATVAERDAFAAEVAAVRSIPDGLIDVLAGIAPNCTPMEGLRTGLSHLGALEGLPPTLNRDRRELRTEAMRLSAATPTIVAALHRLRSGLDPVAPDPALAQAANYLYMLNGTVPDPEAARAIEQYLILALDHGFNASTFTARAVTSTGADLCAALVAAIGSLSGPLHGGAVHRSLETLDAIGTPARAREWVRDAISEGRTIMGFGHPVYRTADPRAQMLRGVAERLGGDRIQLAIEVEAAVEEALAELKPGRELHTNIEWYAAVVMETIGMARDLMVTTFAATRIVGWCAQAIEQATDNRIIRPSASYIGPPPPQPVPSL